MSDRRHRPVRPRSQSWPSPDLPEPIDESSASVDLDDLVASALSGGVEPLLHFANDIVVGCADCAAEAVRLMPPDARSERRSLAVALGVLLGVEPPDVAVLEGLPSWVAMLPHVTIRSVRRRRDGPSWCHLIDVGTSTHHLVTAQVVLDEHGEITSGFVASESIGELERFIRGVGGERGRSFSIVKAETVAPALLAGFARRRLGSPRRRPESCAPDHDPLITWVVRLVVEASENQRRSVERNEIR